MFLTHGLAWDRTYNRNVITDVIFAAFLNCETKCYLNLSAGLESPSELSDWRREIQEDYRRGCQSKCRSKFPEQPSISVNSSLEDLKYANQQLFLGCTIETPQFRSQLDAVERISRRSNGKGVGYIPIRFVPSEKLSRHNKLLLAFDALTLGEALGNTPPSAR